MQRADVAVADGFLAPGVPRDALDGQVNFDQTLGKIHRCVKKQNVEGQCLSTFLQHRGDGVLQAR